KPDGIVVALDDLPHQSGCHAIPFRERLYAAMVVQRKAATAEANPHTVLSIGEHAAALSAGFSGLAMRDESGPIPRQQAARRRAEPERIGRCGESIHSARLDVRDALLVETAHDMAADELVGRDPHGSRAIGMERACLSDGERLPSAAGQSVQSLSRGDPDAAVSGDRCRSHAILVETVERTSGLERVLGQAQQAAAHPDPDVVVAIAIKRPWRSPHAMLVFDRLEQGM